MGTDLSFSTCIGFQLTCFGQSITTKFMKKNTLLLLVTFMLFLAIFIAACGEDNNPGMDPEVEVPEDTEDDQMDHEEEDDPEEEDDKEEEPILDLPAVTSLAIIDHGNAGSIKDLVLKFSQVSEHEDLVEYRLIYSENPISLTDNELFSLEEGRFYSFEAVTDFEHHLEEDFLSVSGDPIQTDVIYEFRLISIGQFAEQTALSSAVEVTLSNQPFFTTGTLGAIDGTEALTLSKDGKYIYSPNNNGAVRMRVSDGTTERIATDLDFPLGGAVDVNGQFYISSYNRDVVYRILEDGEKEVIASGLDGPAGLVFDADGNLFVANYDGSTIDKIDTDGTRTTFCNSALLNGPDGVIIVNNQLYSINFNDGGVFRIDSQGEATLLARIPPNRRTGYITHANGFFYAPSLDGRNVYRIGMDGTLTVISGNGRPGSEDGPGPWNTYNIPNGIVASITGDTLFVGDTQSIRMITIHP